MDFLTDEHRDILRGMKRDRDAGDLEENEYAQERAHVIKMARQEFDARSMQRRVQSEQCASPGQVAPPPRAGGAVPAPQTPTSQPPRSSGLMPAFFGRAGSTPPPGPLPNVSPEARPPAVSATPTAALPFTPAPSPVLAKDTGFRLFSNLYKLNAWQFYRWDKNKLEQVPCRAMRCC